MSRKIYIFGIVFVLAIVLMTRQVIGQQSEDSLSRRPIPGWGVQLYANGEPWFTLVAEAFHFSPDGSFYEVSDEEFQLKVATTFMARSAITGHQIPIDASCGVSVYLDGTLMRDLGNEHTIVALDFTQGMHTLEITNQCGGEPGNWMGIVIGKCLWGTDRNIRFVEASAQ